MLENKPLERIDAEDLQELVDYQISERRSIDYKGQLWRLFSSDAKYKQSQQDEFLKDVSSFANTAGGHLVIGMNEVDGKPTELVGLEIQGKEDEWKKCMEHLMQRRIKPRINADLHFVPLCDSKSSLVIRILPSTIGPHQVLKDESGTFHVRDSKGKHEMDIDELRIAFNASAQVAQTMREFHRERLKLIGSADSPIPINAGPRLVLHLIPQECFTTQRSFKISDLKSASDRAYPISANQLVSREKINLDGHVKVTGDPARTYLLVFRSGIVEATVTDVAHGAVNEPLLYNLLNEKNLLDSLPAYLDILKNLGFRPPIALFVTLCGMRNVAIPQDVLRPMFDRATIAIPEVLIDRFPDNVSMLVQEIGDVIWNAAGLHRCEAFDQNGDWRQLQRLV